MRHLSRPALARIACGIALLAWAALAGLALAAYGRQALAALTFPYPLDYGEGPILDQVLRLARFETLYSPDFSTPPYTVANYPPLFHLAQVPFAWLFGPAYWYGRAMSIASALAAAVLAGLILRRLTGDRAAAVVGGLTLLAIPYLSFWSVLDRVDTLALALSLGGLCAVVCQPDSRRGLLLGAALLVAGAFTRQTNGLAAPLAACAWLWLTGRRRQAFTLAGLAGAGGAAVFALLDLATQGGFHRHIVAANVNPFHLSVLIAHLAQLITRAWPLILAAGLYLALDPLARRTPVAPRAWPLVAPYLLGAAAVAVTIGKEGSNVNYLYELSAALCLAAGAAVARLDGRPWLRVAALALLAAQVYGLAHWHATAYAPSLAARMADRDAIAQLDERVRAAAAGPVLADEYLGLIPLRGGRIYYQPFEFKQLADAGLWDEKALVAAIARQEFPVVLWFTPRGATALVDERWTPAQQAAVTAHYARAGDLAGARVHVPIPAR
jgi:hypothetical protein